MGAGETAVTRLESYVDAIGDNGLADRIAEQTAKDALLRSYHVNPDEDLLRQNLRSDIAIGIANYRIAIFEEVTKRRDAKAAGRNT